MPTSVRGLQFRAKILSSVLLLRLVSIRHRFQAWREKFFVSQLNFMRAALSLRDEKHFLFLCLVLSRCTHKTK